MSEIEKQLKRVQRRIDENPPGDVLRVLLELKMELLKRLADSPPAPRKNSMRVVTIEITEELAAKHKIAAARIVDIIMEQCDGPPDALYLLRKICQKIMIHYGIIDAIDEPPLETDTIQ